MGFDLLKFNFTKSDVDDLAHTKPDRIINNLAFFIPEEHCVNVSKYEWYQCSANGYDGTINTLHWCLRPNNDIIAWASDRDIVITLNKMYGDGCDISVEDDIAAAQIRLMYSLEFA